MIFHSSKKFHSGPKFEFMKRNKINEPTDHSLVLGGYFIDKGEQVIFEHKIDNIRVDLYIPTWSKSIIIEVVGDDRTKDQLKCDRNRDCFLSCNGKNVIRFKNSMIEQIDFITQMKYWFKGTNSFEQQLDKMIQGKVFKEDLFENELDELFDDN